MTPRENIESTNSIIKLDSASFLIQRWLPDVPGLHGGYYMGERRIKRYHLVADTRHPLPAAATSDAG